MGFPVPLPRFCRVFGKRNWEVAGTRYRDVVSEDRDIDRSGGVGLGQCSAGGEAVSVGGFDDEAGCSQGCEARVEGGITDAAGGSQYGERPWLLAVREGGCDAAIDRSRLDTMLGLVIGLNWLEGECVVALGQFKRDARYGGGGPMLDGQDDAIVIVAPEIEVGIAPGVESADGAPAPFLAW
jgi:hypothetical protein